MPQKEKKNQQYHHTTPDHTWHCIYVNHSIEVLLLVWLNESSHGANHELASVPVTVAALLNKGKVVGSGLVVHEINCLLRLGVCMKQTHTYTAHEMIVTLS